MKCFNHENREAVATCQRCGKGLCRECAGKYTPCLCDDCFEAIQNENHAQKVAAAENRRQSRLDRLRFTVGDLIANCVLGAVLCAIVLYTLVKQDYPFAMYGGEWTVMLPMLFCMPTGWRTVARWMRAGEEMRVIVRTYEESGTTLVVEFLIKCVASWFLGIPCFLFQVFKVFLAKKSVKNAEADLERVKR